MMVYQKSQHINSINIVGFCILFPLVVINALQINPSWNFPFAGDNWYFTGGPHKYGHNTAPSGLDFAPSRSAEKIVYPVADGTITHIGPIPNDSRAGNAIKIDHGGGWETWYMHLERYASRVKVGMQVRTSTPIAIAGGTGGFPVHLHLELRKDKQPVSWDGQVIGGWTVRYTGNYNGYLARERERIVANAPATSAQLVRVDRAPGGSQGQASSGSSNSSGSGASSSNYTCYPGLTPHLRFDGVRYGDTTQDGTVVNGYYMTLANAGDFPSELFAPTSELPPCGLTRNASRSWIHIYSASGVRLYGYCNGQTANMGINVPAGTPPPSSVYIVIVDRACGISYRSNSITLSP